MASLTSAHEHTLFFMDTSKLLATRNLPFWGCDACKRTSKQMQVTHSYRCMSCDIDICEDCSQPIATVLHNHKLVITDAKKIYPNGKWACDNCRTDYRSQGRYVQ